MSCKTELQAHGVVLLLAINILPSLVQKLCLRFHMARVARVYEACFGSLHPAPGVLRTDQAGVRGILCELNIDQNSMRLQFKTLCSLARRAVCVRRELLQCLFALC